MRKANSVALATWMLERLAPGRYTEAISGDLLEGLRCGYPVGWYWRQVLWVIGVELGTRARKLAEPLLFCIFWSGLYPGWLFIFEGRLIQGAAAHWGAPDVPYATSLKSVGGIIPAAAFLCCGLLAYLLCHKEVARAVGWPRFLCGLSISLNVILILTVRLRHELGRPEIGFGHALGDGLSEKYIPSMSLYLAISLFAAILSILPGQRAPDASFASE